MSPLGAVAASPWQSGNRLICKPLIQPLIGVICSPTPCHQWPVILITNEVIVHDGRNRSCICTPACGSGVDGVQKVVVPQPQLCNCSQCMYTGQPKVLEMIRCKACVMMVAGLVKRQLAAFVSQQITIGTLPIRTKVENILKAIFISHPHLPFMRRMCNHVCCSLPLCPSE